VSPTFPPKPHALTDDDGGKWIEAYLSLLPQKEMSDADEPEEAEKRESHGFAVMGAKNAVNSVYAKGASKTLFANKALMAGKAGVAERALIAAAAKNAKFAKEAKNALRAKLAKNALYAHLAYMAEYAKHVADPDPTTTSGPPTK